MVALNGDWSYLGRSESNNTMSILPESKTFAFCGHRIVAKLCVWLRRKVIHYSVCMRENLVSNKGSWKKIIHREFLLSNPPSRFYSSPPGTSVHHESSVLARDAFSTSKTELVTRKVVSLKRYRIGYFKAFSCIKISRREFTQMRLILAGTFLSFMLDILLWDNKTYVWVH
jgi:hypothetical protein